MSLIDTTNTIESSLFLKAKLPKNMVGDNYFIESLQDKINREWNYRHNVCDIEEENMKQKVYTQDKPLYTPIEAIVQTVIGEKGEKLADDWKKLVFKERSHQNFLGKRFRFSLDFEKNVTMTEEEKDKLSSIWLASNKNKTISTNSVVVRRCNSSLVFGGSPTLEYTNITETHIEPVILETDMNNINLFYNRAGVNLPQAELYAIVQNNYFTKKVKINDRFIIGDVDTVDVSNNELYKVKAIFRFSSQSTFDVTIDEVNDNVPFITLALEKVSYSAQDNLKKRLASGAPLYKVEIEQDQPIPTIEEVEEKEEVEENITTDNNEETDSNKDAETEQQQDNYVIKIINDYEDLLLQGEELELFYELYNNDKVVQGMQINVQSDLLGTDKDANYYSTTVGNNTLKVLNLRAYLKNSLQITLSCDLPNGEKCEKIIKIKLGGDY